MLEVKFYEEGEALGPKLRFAVVAALCGGRWVLCKHKARATWEFPGGHREPGEPIAETARRELYEETGALDYRLRPVCAYGVRDPQGAREETFGMLYLAEISRFGPLSAEFEMERIQLFDRPPQAPAQWTYPKIQPPLLERLGRELARE